MVAPLISLTYLSSATVPYDEGDLRDLLTEVREKNVVLGVTGMLLYAGGSFIQTVEGEQPVVDGLFARIEADPRHRDVMMTLREEVGGRSFPDWSMGFEHLTDEQARALPGFNDFLRASRAVRETSLEFSRAGVFHRIFSDFPR